MKRLITLLALAGFALVLPACHDGEHIAHTTTTTTEHTTRIAPAASHTTTVERY
jgi:hypothetical protein